MVRQRIFVESEEEIKGSGEWGVGNGEGGLSSKLTL
jgi:hypothetical protein